MPRTPASTWATAPTRNELVRALRDVTREAEALAADADQFQPRAVTAAKELLAREEHARARAEAA